MTIDHISTEQKYKVTRSCPRIGCKDEGIHPLYIILIDRIVYFCSAHRKEIENCRLVSQ